MNNLDKELVQQYLQLYNDNINKPDKELAQIYLNIYHGCMNYNNKKIDKNDICRQYYDLFLRFTDNKKE